MTTTETTGTRAGRLRVPRSRGAVSGVLLILLGIWGAIVPFVGPYFDFAYTPDKAWTWTAARGWLDVLPGAVVAVAGLIMLLSVSRIVACVASWFAVAGGAWLIIGPPLAGVIGFGIGLPTASSTGMRALEALAYFYALGALIVFLASMALGRLSVHSVADWRAAERRVDADRAAREPARTPTAVRSTPAAPVAVAPVATGPTTAAPVPTTGAAETEDPDVVARENARRAIVREQNDHAHRHFLHRGDRVREAAPETETDHVSAGDDRSRR